MLKFLLNKKPHPIKPASTCLPVAALCITFALVGCAGGFGNPYANSIAQTKKDGRESAARARLELKANPTCRLGLFVHDNGRIGWVSRNAKKAGLRFGDKVISYGGLEFSTSEAFVAWIKQHRPGDDISMTVQQETGVNKLSVHCLDHNQNVRTYINFYEMMAGGDWEGCVDAVQELIRSDGRSSANITEYVICATGIRWASGQPPSYVEGGAAYEAVRLVIRESSVSQKALEDIRGYVLSRASLLRDDWRFPTLANDLEIQYQSALEGLAVAEKAPDTKPTPKRATGTCFAASPNGVLITAYHVVKDAKSIRVRLSDGNVMKAKLRTFSAANDLAILQIGPPTPHFLPLAKARSVRAGDQVFTMGYPAAEILGQEPKFTDGAVSALSGVGGEASLLQISVPVQPGNSGGPLVNERGEVVGIVTSTAAVQAFLSATGTLPQNVNWAVKADYIRLMFNAPVVKSVAANRSQAIEWTRRAICMVEASPR